MSEPTVTCAVCGSSMVVRFDARVDDQVANAKRKLGRACLARGHRAEITYRAGVIGCLQFNVSDAKD